MKSFSRSKTRYVKNCLSCGVEFITARHDTKTCGATCRQRFARSGGTIMCEESDDIKCESDAKPGYIYLIGGDTGYLKIGLSVNPAQRVQQLQYSSPVELRVLATVYVGNMWEAEKLLHEKYAGKRMWGEWFDVGYTEAIEAMLLCVKN